MSAAVVGAGPPTGTAQPLVQPASAAPQEDDEVVILDSDGEDHSAYRARSSHGAGPSRPAAAAAPAGRRRSRPAAANTGSSGGAGDIIDLTSDSPPTTDDIQIVRSTVVPRQPSRGAKRPRMLPPAPAVGPSAGGAVLPPGFAGMSPTKQLLMARLYNPPPPPPPEPEPEGPKCGICMEAMGGSQGRQMGSGSCGHVYCYDCLVEAVKAQKKCPTCRKSMQARQIHKVFVNFS